jgi:hypothetical protein
MFVGMFRPNQWGDQQMWCTCSFAAACGDHD